MPEIAYLSLRYHSNLITLIQIRMYGVDEEIYSQVKLQFLFTPEQLKYIEK